MQIELDADGPAEGSVRGRLVDAPPGKVEVALEVTHTSPSGATVERFSAVDTTDAKFDLQYPTWPTSYRGELLRVEWSLVATPESGDAVSCPIEVVTSEIDVESPTSDDFNELTPPFDWRVPILAGVAMVVGLLGVIIGIATDRTWLWVLAGFVVFFAGVALAGSFVRIRQRNVFGHVRCRVRPSTEALECTVLADPPEELRNARVTATLYVTEMASSSGNERGASDHEHVVVEHTVDLDLAGPGEWCGTIPMVVAAAAPLSHHRRRDAEITAVSWIVKLTLSAQRAPDYHRILPLVALPAELDPALRPHLVEIPKVAR